MKKYQKRLNLAAAILTVSHLFLENVNALIDLLSKVVNYDGSHVQEL